ncbi:MAG: heme ABC exporter ATP-binding protein CcmA [Pseudomonadota bacterium]
MLGRQLILENIACVRGGRLLFKDISCALGPGDATLIRGPNGAGKSSLLRVIAGLLKPYAGRVAHQGTLALADEAHALDPRLPLDKALGFWAAIDGSESDTVNEAMGAMRISHLASVPVRMLSTGQKKRATLARVIASRADIWLLDEPGNGLDKESLTLLDAAMAIHRVRGGIIMAASHQPLGLSDVKTIGIGEG